MYTLLARAEEFPNALAAKRRYRELDLLMQEHGQTEAALLNTITEGRYVVMLLADMSARHWADRGHPGQLVDLDDQYWQALLNRHERQRGLALRGRINLHHERPLRLRPDGTGLGEE